MGMVSFQLNIQVQRTSDVSVIQCSECTDPVVSDTHLMNQFSVQMQPFLEELPAVNVGFTEKMTNEAFYSE